jgi:putative transposase
MKRFKKLSHTVYECKYHVVWCPKYRFRVMDEKIRYYVRDVIRRVCSWKKLTIVEGNVCKDHIHLVIEIPPHTSVSNAMGKIKGRSAIKIFNKFHSLRKKYWGHHFWAKGYCVSTIGLDEEKVRKYVRYQQRKDKEKG